MYSQETTTLQCLVSAQLTSWQFWVLVSWPYQVHNVGVFLEAP
jgi:hypothetical protein